MSIVNCTKLVKPKTRKPPPPPPPPPPAALPNCCSCVSKNELVPLPLSLLLRVIRLSIAIAAVPTTLSSDLNRVLFHIESFAFVVHTTE